MKKNLTYLQDELLELKVGLHFMELELAKAVEHKQSSSFISRLRPVVDSQKNRIEDKQKEIKLWKEIQF